MTRAIVSIKTDLAAVTSDPTADLTTFPALTFAWTWGLWAISSTISYSANQAKTVVLLASTFGPSVSGFSVMLLFDGAAELGNWVGTPKAASLVRAGGDLREIWGISHLPVFWMPGMARANLTISLFMAASTGRSVVLARLSVNARFSVFSAVVLHVAINARSRAAPVTQQTGDLRPYTIVTGHLFATTIGLLCETRATTA